MRAITTQKIIVVSSCFVFSVLTNPLRAEDQSGPFPAPTATSTQVSTEFHFDSWDGSRGTNVYDPAHGKGWQFYAPTTGTLTAQWDNSLLLSTSVRAGYVASSHDTQGQQAFYSGATDTQLSATAVFLNFETVRPFTGLSLNLPSGESYLPGNNRFLRMDPDLVDLGSLGEGFNTTPTAGFTISPTANLAITPSVGYSFRGDFYRDALNVITIQNGSNSQQFAQPAAGTVHPGDVLIASVNLSYAEGPLKIEGAFSYMAQTATTQNGAGIGEQGDRYVSNIAVTYAATSDLNILFNGSWGYSENNKIPVNNVLLTEMKNSNSNVFIGSVQPVYSIDANTRIGVNYSILFRDHNFYSLTEDRFIPQRLKQSAGILGEYDFDNTLTFGLKLNRFWIHDSVGAYLPASIVQPNNVITYANFPPALDYTGWQVIASVTKKF